MTKNCLTKSSFQVFLEQRWLPVEIKILTDNSVFYPSLNPKLFRRETVRVKKPFAHEKLDFIFLRGLIVTKLQENEGWIEYERKT